MKNRIVCCIVTYNRLEKLKIAIDHYQKQSCFDFTLVIVDNHSTDGTLEFLQNWSKTSISFPIIIKELSENLGGSYGFYEALKTGMEETNGEWFVLADDDAYPEQEFIYRLKKHIDSLPSNYGCVCSKVCYPSGEIQTNHRRLLQPTFFKVNEKPIPDEAYLKTSFELNLFSFVGCCLNRKTINSVGYPIKDFFIWYDDTEYSLRVNKKYKIICYPDLLFIHDTAKPSLTSNNCHSWKEYYGIRNRLVAIKRNYPHRYYSYAYWRKKAAIFLKYNYKDKSFSDIARDALKDAKNNVLGKNKKYLPK